MPDLARPRLSERLSVLSIVLLLLVLGGLTLLLGPAVLAVTGLLMVIFAAAGRSLRPRVRLALAVVGVALAVTMGLPVLDLATGHVTSTIS